MTTYPAYRAYTIIKGKQEGAKGTWVSIGAAWHHKDQRGLHVVLDALPLDGHISLRTYEPRERAADERPSSGKPPYGKKEPHRERTDNRRWR